MDGKLESDRESNGVYRQRSRTRSRSPTDHPKSLNFRDGKRPQGNPIPKRVYVTNIPYNCRWSELKDLFREKVGDVAYVDLFEDESGRFKGNGIVEFHNADSVQKAIELLNKFDYKGRPLYVKEDTIGDRGGRGGSLRGGPMPRGGPGPMPKFNPMPIGGGGGPPAGNFNTYGLSPKFLEYLGITGPLVNKIFVTNLSYRVDEVKLRDVFSLAGKVMRVDIKKDKDGQSKGLALVEFEHPVEAVQAISMFHEQKLFNRPMTIRMDRFVSGDNEPPKLPSGLSGIGKGLGTSGQPLQIPKEPGMATGGFPLMGGVGSGGMGPSSMNMMSGNMGMSSPMSMMNSGGGMGGMPSMGSNMGGMSTPAAGHGMGTMGGMGGSAMLGGGGAASAGYSSGLAPNSTMAAPSPGMGMGMNSAPAPSSAMGFGNDRYDGVRGGGMVNDSFSSGQSDTVLLRNLPSNVTWQILKDRFRDVGDIRHVDLKGRGMAVMRFGSERDARRAVDLMHGLRVDGRPIEVTLYN